MSIGAGFQHQQNDSHFNISLSIRLKPLQSQKMSGFGNRKGMQQDDHDHFSFEPRCQFRDQYLLLNVGLKSLADLEAQNHICSEGFMQLFHSHRKVQSWSCVLQARCKKKVILGSI